MITEMHFDFSLYFKKYETLVYQADRFFERVKNDYPDSVTCQEGCNDCCYAIFDLTLVEAIYLNHKFRETVGADMTMMEKANKADRAVFRLKKQAFRKFKENNKNEVAILHDLGRKRIRCPLLDDEGSCALYEYRPITCRLYGIPTSIRGRGYSCGKSGFSEGETYPMVNMDKFFQRLKAISAEIAADIKTPYKRMDDMLVPLSMAILTEYDDRFFGFSGDQDEENGRA